jgi:hypothetical protein
MLIKVICDKKFSMILPEKRLGLKLIFHISGENIITNLSVLCVSSERSKRAFKKI